MKIKRKILLIAISLGVVMSFSCSAFVLEQKHPSLPESQDLEEIVEANEGLGEHVRYYVRLALFIAIGICTLVLIVAGVLYLSSSLRPGLVLTAKTMIKRSFLGLFIILISSLILYIVNPQLLIFVSEIPPVLTKDVFVGSYKENDVVFVQIPGFSIPPKMYEEVYPYKKGFIQAVGGEFIFTDGFGNPINPDTGNYLEEEDKALKYPEDTTTFLKNNILASISGRNPPPNFPDPSNFLYQAELPFYKAEETAKDITELLGGTKNDKGESNKDGLIDLLKNCECGQADWTIIWEGIKGKCITYMEASSPFGDKIPESGQQICKEWYRFDDCGTKRDREGFLCDVRDVIFETVPVTINVEGKEEERNVFIEKVKTGTEEEAPWALLHWEAVDWEPEKAWKISSVFSEMGIENFAENFDDINQDRLIKYKIQKLQELLADLKAEQPQFTAEQFTFLGDTLKVNAKEFLLSEGVDIRFQYDFFPYKEYLENFGLNIIVELPEHLEPFEKIDIDNNSLVQNTTARFSAFINPFMADDLTEAFEERAYTFEYPAATAYLVKHGPSPFISGTIVDHNQFAIMESQRASLFSVLTGLSLETIQQIFKDCLNSAFGQAEYVLPDSITDIIKATMEEGVMDRLMEEISKKALANGISDSFMAGFKGVVSNDLKADLILKCAEKCKVAKECEQEICKDGKWACSQGILDPNNENFNYEVRMDCLQDLLKNDSCVKGCVKGTISPTIISDTIADFFTGPIEKKLPDSFQEALEGKLRESIFTDRLNQILDSEMIDLYNQVVDKALSKSFTTLIPQIQTALETKLETLPFIDRVFGFLNKADKYLNNKFKDLKSYIAKNAEQLRIGLRDRTVGLVQGKIDSYKENHPGEFPENMKINDCYKKLDQGYIFEVNQAYITFMNTDQGVIAPSPGKCVELTPEKLNNIGEGIPMNFNFRNPTDSKTIYVNYDYSDLKEKEIICRDVLGQCWGTDTSIVAYNDTEEERVKIDVQHSNPKCYQCSSFEVTHLTKINSERLKDKFKAGFISFGEKLFTAFIDIMTDTMMKYATVWIEDAIISPLSSYFKEANDFYDNFHGYLNASVQDVLPRAITETLQSDIDTILNNVCGAYRDQQNADLTGEDYEASIDLYKLGEGLTWKDGDTIEVGVRIPDELGKNVCNLSTHFHTTLMEEIAYSNDDLAEVGGILNKTIKNLLDNMCPEDDKNCVSNFLNQTPAQILWPEFNNILNLIKTSPKDLICGDNIALKFSDKATNRTWDIVLASDKQISIRNKCDQMRSKELGLFQTLDPVIYSNMSDKEQTIYGPWCHFIFNACERPLNFSFLDQTLGKAIGQATNLVCNLMSQEVSEPESKCEGVCLGEGMPDNNMKSDQDCSSFYKIGCEACSSVLKNSTARNLYYYSIQGFFGPVQTRDKPKEEEAYQFLLAFTPLLELEIKKVALQRGFTTRDWDALNSKNYNIEHFNDMLGDSINQEDPLIALIYYFTKELTPRDLLMRLPFGIIKPFKKGEETLLSKSNNLDYNFLSRTPYDLLYFDLCKQIKEDFQQDYPNWTMNALAQADWDNLYERFLPYSMESLHNNSISKRFDAIFQSSAIDTERKAPYLFCLSLDYSPAEVLGLDQKLVSYVRPDEYKILFQLLRDKLDDSERPEVLNQALDYLFYDTPISALYKVAGSLSVYHLFDKTLTQRDLDFLNGDEETLGWDNGFIVRSDWKDMVSDEAKTYLLNYLGIDLYSDNVPENISSVDTDGAISPDLWLLFKYHGIELPTQRPVIVKNTGDYWLVEGKYKIKQIGDILRVSALTDDEELVDRSVQNASKAMADFLNTEIGEQLKNPPVKQEGLLIVDMLIQQYCSDTHQDPFKRTTDYKECVLRFFSSNNVDWWNKQQLFFKLTPVALLEKYLTRPLLPGPFEDENSSLMDKVASISPLGTPILDLVGRGWLDKGFDWLNKGKDKAYEMIDKTLEAQEDKIKAFFDDAFIEAPKAIAETMVGLVAKAIGIEVGKSLADEIAGACYDASGPDVCLFGAGQVYRVSNGKGQCCDMGKAVACQSRCSSMIFSLEEEKCKTNTYDLINTTYEKYTLEKSEKGGCCNVKVSEGGQEFCRKCRPINVAQGAKCREDKDGNPLEEMLEVEGMKVCCHKERYVASEVSEIQDKCCTTVLECVSYKFADALEVVADMLADGLLPLDSLID